MDHPRTIGNRIAPPHFLLFAVVGVVAVGLAWLIGHELRRAVMLGFDVAAVLFLATVAPLLRIREGASIRAQARENDANRAVLLAITFIVMIVLFAAIATETLKHSPEPYTKILIVVTLAIAWLFSNTVYALHYAHLAYGDEVACSGLSFPGTEEPVYWDFVYFAFTLGMTFQTSDVTISDDRIRRVVTMHSLAAFVVNIGVLAFTINVLGT
ncbi:MAG: DUF1345 domain-containing protein [Pseudomonadota bacterium]|nr:DUF1345 domain-containing protein [Pseudomonadota bacterium]